MEDDLSDPIVVAQVDENQLSVISFSVHPPGQLHDLGLMLHPELFARMRPEWM